MKSAPLQYANALADIALEQGAAEPVLKQLAEVDEGVLQQHGLPERLGRRPEEEDERDRDLRRDQEVGQPGGAEDDAFFH